MSCKPASRSVPAACSLFMASAARYGFYGEPGGKVEPLLHLGAPDGDTRELALGPDRFGDFATDGFFIVGESDAAKDWPYVHRGSEDLWAGSTSHVFMPLSLRWRSRLRHDCIRGVVVAD